MSNKKDLLLLFDRPKEPVFIAKGDDRAAFQVPENFLVSWIFYWITLKHTQLHNMIDWIFQESRFKPIGVQLFNRFGSEAQRQISVNDIAIPDITEVSELTRFENFSLFIPKHRRIAGRLIEIFIGKKKPYKHLYFSQLQNRHNYPTVINMYIHVCLLDMQVYEMWKI